MPPEHPMFQQRFAGVGVPVPEYAGDTGEPDAALAAALGRQAVGAGSRHEVLAALVGARLLVPVVAVLDSVVDPPVQPVPDAVTVLPQEKDSHMATVTLVQPDGRRGLLAFTGTAALAAWRADARPVAAPAARVARAALEEGADAVVLDVAGPAPYPVQGPALTALAAGTAYHPATDPEVAVALRAVLDRIAPGVPLAVGDGTAYSADLLVQVGLVPDQARRLGDLLSADRLLQARCPGGIAVTGG